MMPIETFGIWQVVLLVLFALTLYFFSRVVKKAGYSPWWALLGVIPVLNIVLLWVFAFARWPRAGGAARAGSELP
jgi:hypothetical protein